jgi:hypothetical protein
MSPFVRWGDIKNQTKTICLPSFEGETKKIRLKQYVSLRSKGRHNNGDNKLNFHEMMMMSALY